MSKQMHCLLKSWRISRQLTYYWPQGQNSSSFTHKYKALEEKWIPVVRMHDTKISKLWDQRVPKSKRSFVLSMFPYPSGNLHLGHLRVYTVSDVLFRYKCMKGLTTLQPMGWDAFGLPAENAAIDRDIPPQTWTKRNIHRMREQMNSTMLLGLDWSRELSTCDPAYYKWTQWIFLKLYEAGLAYHRSAFVNWDPVDQTVLADELVDTEGKSWRSGAVVVRRPLRQWYFRTTNYSKSLLDGLKTIENNEWRDVVQMQRGWLGKLDGTQMEFDLQLSSTQPNNPELQSEVQAERLAVFTKYPSLAAADLISYVAVSRESIYFDDHFRLPEPRRGLNWSRKLILTSHYADGVGPKKLTVSSTTEASPWPEKLAVSVRHPFTGREIPMVRSPGLQLKQVVAFPNELRFHLKDGDSESLANTLELSNSPCKFSQQGKSGSSDQLIEPDTLGIDELDQLILSTPVAELNNVPYNNSIEGAMGLLRRSGRGGYWSSELRTDWLVSRQRYWGTPIPIVHCKNCGTVPVPEDQLPVLLPPLKQSFKRGAVPLKDNLEWQKTTCPKCGSLAERETDTLDTFVDSAWYYLRYLDPHNSEVICDRYKAAQGLPVDIYIGGIEHAIRHLFYARFIAHFLNDLGVIPCREPFLRFLPVGLVFGQTFVEPRTGRFVAPSEVEAKTDAKGHTIYCERDSHTPLRMYWDKMSKSKLNGVDPTDAVEKYGVELVRLTMLANVGPHRSRKWQEDGGGVMRGIQNWQTKMQRLVEDVHSFSTSRPNDDFWQIRVGPDDPLCNHPSDFRSFYNRVLNEVNHFYNDSFVLSSVIARLQELTDLLRKTSLSASGPGPTSFLYLRALADLIVMLSPLAPVYSCELWSTLQTALYHRAPPNVCKLLSPTRMHLRSGDPVSNSVCWPYDLTRIVLDQPFPSGSDMTIDALDKRQNAEE
ncbi:unnamed protein product [Calicophoron daubneyi]|uniref:leucine--tRNA ligase n=1 Tax=Calicophoron daubneyi TaxID=300641 RepID=A0AAV2TJD5_CALDB